MWNKDQIAAAECSRSVHLGRPHQTDYKKMITWSAPTTAGTAKLVVNTMVQKKANGKKTSYKNDAGEADVSCYDDTDAMNYFKVWMPTPPNTPSLALVLRNMVGKGECKIGIGFLHDVITQIVDNKYTTIGMAAPTRWHFLRGWRHRHSQGLQASGTR
jgi:iron(III) transport system substrate-binding protein